MIIFSILDDSEWDKDDMELNMIADMEEKWFQSIGMSKIDYKKFVWRMV